MSLFQNSVGKKYLSELNETIINSKYAAFQEYFGNPERQENIRNSKEEQFALLWLCLSKDSLLSNRPLDIKKSSIVLEEDITKKVDLQSLKAAIEKTDDEIDQMVYELYGLSEDEIAIVEGE